MAKIIGTNNKSFPQRSGASNVRYFWDNLDMKKDLSARYSFICRFFHLMLLDLSKNSGIVNGPRAKANRINWILQHNPNGFPGDELQKQIMSARVKLANFSRLNYVADKNEGKAGDKKTDNEERRATNDELIEYGLDERTFVAVLEAVSHFCAWAYNLEIPPRIQEILSSMESDENAAGEGIPQSELDDVSVDDMANKAYRFPFIIIIDNSISMGEIGRLEKLQQGLNDLYGKIEMSSILRSRVELYVATCGGGANEIVNFAMIDRQMVPLNQLILSPFGACKMASTIDMALDRLKVRLDMYSDASHDIRYFRPWMLILSDGKFKEDMSKVIDRINKDFSKLQVYVRGLSGKANMDNLRLLDPHAAILNSLDGFFKDVFVSLKRIQTSIPGGERIHLINQQGFARNQ